VRHDDDQDEADDEPARETEVECPYCGEIVEITLDPAGGASQEYIEDCEVCCQPWHVQVHYGAGGAVEVHVEQA